MLILGGDAAFFLDKDKEDQILSSEAKLHEIEEKYAICTDKILGLPYLCLTLIWREYIRDC